MGWRRRGNKRSCATKAQARSSGLATCHMPHATTCPGYRCRHSPAGLAVRHVQIPIEMKVEHAQLGYSALPQRYIRRRCSTRSSSSSSCSRSSCSSSSRCCSNCCSSCIGVGTLRIRIHHDGATWCRTGEQTMRCGATTPTAAAATMMSMMTMTIMMLMMFLKRVEATGGTAREITSEKIEK